MIKRARLSATVIGIALLAGCAVIQPGGDSTTAPPAASSSATDSSEDAFSATGDTPKVIDPEILSSIITEIRSQSEDARHLFAAWPQFGLRTVDDGVTAYYLRVIRSYESELAESEGNAEGYELNINWRTLAASPEVVGFASDGFRSNGASGADLWHSFWFAPRTGKILGVGDLVSHDPTLAALRRAASSRPEVDLARAGTDPLAASSLFAFGAGGSIIVGFDQCQVADCAAGRVTLTIPADQSDRLLTAAGRQARTATSSPTSPNSVTPTSPGTTPPTSKPPTPPSEPPGRQVDCRKQKCVALTFDDGPGPFTRKLLGYLSDREVPATFFMLGQQVEAYPQVARTAAEAGHELGVHTWDHRALTRLGTPKIDWEIKSTVRVIQKEAHVKARTLRPPYGAMNAKVRAAAKRAGLPLILWDVDTLDWKTKSTKKTVEASLSQARKGSIILLHDVHATSVEAVPEIIDGLRTKGFVFVTVSQLLGKTKPGVKYFHR